MFSQQTKLAIIKLKPNIINFLLGTLINLFSINLRLSANWKSIFIPIVTPLFSG